MLVCCDGGRALEAEEIWSEGRGVEGGLVAEEIGKVKAARWRRGRVGRGDGRWSAGGWRGGGAIEARRETGREGTPLVGFFFFQPRF